MIKLLTTPGRGLRRMIARLAVDTSGLSAIEFALIAPLMLVMFFGTIEISQGYGVSRKVAIAARTLSDLASRSTSLNDTDITNFRAILNAVMLPYPAVPLQATVTQVYIDPKTGAARTQWSKGSAAIKSGDVVAIPASLIGRDSSGKIMPDQYLIVSKTSYHYTPAVGQILGKTGVTLEEAAYTRPRQSVCVNYAPDKGPSCVPK